MIVPGNRSAWSDLGTIVLDAGATLSQPFHAAYAGSVFGPVSAVSSPPVTRTAVRGAARPGRGGGTWRRGGYVLDAYGGVHAFGGAPTLRGFGVLARMGHHAWDRARSERRSVVSSSTGYGGLHPFGASRSGDVGRSAATGRDGTSPAASR